MEQDICICSKRHMNLYVLVPVALLLGEYSKTQEKAYLWRCSLLFTRVKFQKHPQCAIHPFISIIKAFYNGVDICIRLWGHMQVIKHNLDVACKVQRGK